MGSSDWPTWWVLLAPVMMLAFMAACMTSMRCMMRRVHGHADADSAEAARGADLARAGPHVAARFPAGQTAFEAYRTETLQHLDREEGEFHDFLGRLRGAKDKAEFERFMAERRRPPPG